MHDYYGPWAVIAGGSEGVGAAFAEQLAAAGINLLLLARKPGPLEETAERCRALGVDVRTLAVDLTAVESRQAIADAVADVEVGLLVYNAGADSQTAEFLDIDPGHIQRLVDLNITTPLALVQHFGRGMRERGRGGILLTGSLAGEVGQARHTVYGGTKAFGRTFAEGLWVELRDHGVHVLELVLGLTRTPAMARAGIDFDMPGVVVSEPEDVAREGLARLPYGPVHVIGQDEAAAAFRSNPDRAMVVSKLHRATERLFAGRES